MESEEIPKRSQACTLCGQKFLPSASYYTLLDERGRTDCCRDCFVKREKSLFWKGSMPEKRRTLDSKAYALFKRFYSAKENEDLLYLLALYLERRGQLVRRKRDRFFEDPAEDVRYSVPPTPFTLRSQKELIELLEKEEL